MSNCEISMDEAKNILTAYIIGDIDHHNAKPVRDKIDNALYLYRPKELLMDLSKVDFMDSSGLGLILGRYTKAKELQCEFAILNPCDMVIKILSLAGADRIIRIIKEDA